MSQRNGCGRQNAAGKIYLGDQWGDSKCMQCLGHFYELIVNKK